MSELIEVGVIGLGKFGFALAEALRELGHTVVGVDVDMDKVRHAQDILSQVYQADATDRKALQQVGIADLDYVVVSTGKSMERSILVALNLQELKAKAIWVKAVSEEHEKVLTRLGVDFVVFPERFVARQLAHRLGVPGLLEYLPLGSGVAVRETTVEHWEGKTLRELALPMEKEVQVVAVKRVGDEMFNFVPKANQPLKKGDILVMLGENKHIQSIKS